MTMPEHTQPISSPGTKENFEPQGGRPLRSSPEDADRVVLLDSPREDLLSKGQRAVLAAVREALRDVHFQRVLADVLIDALDRASLVEPLYGVEAAQRLIPCTRDMLTHWSRMLRIPKRYRIDADRRRRRLYYASELIAIRRRVLRGEVERGVLTHAAQT